MQITYRIHNDVLDNTPPEMCDKYRQFAATNLKQRYYIKQILITQEIKMKKLRKKLHAEEASRLMHEAERDKLNQRESIFAQSPQLQASLQPYYKGEKDVVTVNSK